MIRRMAWRNERHLYRRKDEATCVEIFSGIPAEASLKTYHRDYWWSDAWDPMEYGRDYDFGRPFFEQFFELMSVVPWPSRNVVNLVNTEYAEHAGELKNCYLFFDGDRSENCAYAVDAYFEKDSFDITHVGYDEMSYDSSWLAGCRKVFFSVWCEKCDEVWFSRNCTGCTNCFGCVNLRSKQYYIFNKPYTKEAYAAFLHDLNTGSYRSLQAVRPEVRRVWQAYPYRYMNGSHHTAVSGDYIMSSKNVRDCWNIFEGENLRFCQYALFGVKDSYDFTIWGDRCELIYESLGIGDGARNVRFCLDCWPASSDMEYAVRCASSHNLFGCVGLRKKEYCVFNKQYSRDEYAALREKIIRHMNDTPYTDAKGRVYRYGEFFPPEASPFSYQDTLAYDFFPLEKDQAQARGYVWRDAKGYHYAATLSAGDLPDHIRDASDSITKEIIRCLSCVKPYRIISSELNFLRKMELPLPRFCPECRWAERAKETNPPHFYRRVCQCAGGESAGGEYRNQVGHEHGSGSCPREFETGFLPDRPEIIYCEQCYNVEAA